MHTACDMCSCGVDLTYITSPHVGSTSGTQNNYTMSCGGRAGGNEAMYYAMLAPGASIDIGMTSNDYDSMHESRYGGGCPGTNVVECTDGMCLQGVCMASVPSITRPAL